MFDRIEKFNKSTIQHGNNNNRIYLMKLHPEDKELILTRLDQMAEVGPYTKIVAKVPEWACDMFASHGYQQECSIPGFYNGEETVHFMSRFTSVDRSLLNPDLRAMIDTNINIAHAKKNDQKTIALPQEFTIRKLEEEDIHSLVDLYKAVFRFYPFPIFDTMYIGVFADDKLYAASSAEIDYQAQNAEMTDFARHPDCSSGLNLSYLLLVYMEEAMKVQNIKTLYTIARAYSAGMNTTFARMNYTLAGTLINNTLINEGIESMNVWYKAS
jgi:putative beta-lysine N-acetyltransferase